MTRNTDQLRQRPADGVSLDGRTRFGRRTFLAAACCLPVLRLADPGPATAAEADRYAMRVIQSGHSLTDPIVPMLNSYLVALGVLGV